MSVCVGGPEGEGGREGGGGVRQFTQYFLV